MAAVLLRAVVMVAGLALMAACGARDPGSPYLPPPQDPERVAVEAALAQMVQDPELQMPPQGDYLIGPGDELAISLLNRPEILGEKVEEGLRYRVKVTENAFIVMPYIGAIRVHGRSAAQFQEDLRAAYAGFIQDPEPLVTIEKFSRNQITVLGTVRNPGRYPYEQGDTLLEGIFRAGGLTFGGKTGGLAPGRYLKIYREKIPARERLELTPEQLLQRLTEGDKLLPRREIVIPIDTFINQGELSWNIPLIPGDVVYIPPAGTVFVHGRVRYEGVVFLGPSLRTVTQVVGERGGLRIGAASIVEVVRHNPGEDPVSYYFDIRDQMIRREPDFLLQDGDQIFVYSNPWRVVLEYLDGIMRTSISAGASATYNPI
jgi:polysaccharide export outer membrane protein